MEGAVNSFKRVLSATALILGLSAFAPLEAHRYRVAYSVEGGGAPTVSGEIFMAVGSEARMEQASDRGDYVFNAALAANGARLTLQTEVRRGDSILAEPTLMLNAEGSAQTSSNVDQATVTVRISPEP